MQYVLYGFAAIGALVTSVPISLFLVGWWLGEPPSLSANLSDHDPVYTRRHPPPVGRAE